MHGEELEARTGDGVARAWWYRAGDGARPAVLLYTDAYGVRPAVQEMAARLAGLGYSTLLPDIFYRAGDYPPFDKATVWNDPPERARLMALMQTITLERLRADSAARPRGDRVEPGGGLVTDAPRARTASWTG